MRIHSRSKNSAKQDDSGADQEPDQQGHARGAEGRDRFFLDTLASLSELKNQPAIVACNIAGAATMA